MPRRSQKVAFLSQNRKLKQEKKERKERKEVLAQRELGYRDGERFAQSVLEMMPEKWDTPGLRLRPSLTAENLSKSLQYLSNGLPAYRATKILKDSLTSIAAEESYHLHCS